MNIVQLQDQLKNFSQDQLIREMQMPSGNAPQYLVLGEIMRRKRMQQDMVAQQAKGESSGTVAEDAIAAAGAPQGGIASMARAMAPQTDMVNNTGVQAMASGGPVRKMAAGDKVVKGGIIYIEQADGSLKAQGGAPQTPVSTAMPVAPMRTSQLPGIMGRSAFTDPTTPARIRQLQDIIADPKSTMLDKSSAALELNDIQASSSAATGLTGSETLVGKDLGYGMVPSPTGPQLNLDVYREEFVPTGNPMIDSFAADGVTALNSLVGKVPQELIDKAMPRAIYADQLKAQSEGRAAAESNLSDASTLEDAIRSGRLSEEDQRAAQLEIDRLIQDSKKAVPPASAVEDLSLSMPPAEELISNYGTTQGTPLTMADIALPSGARPDVSDEEVAPPAQEELPPAPPQVPPGPVGGGTGSGSGGIAGAGGMSSYEQELMDMLQRREKAAQQDKWLALAQVGLNMMSSKQPTLLGAVGESGLKGVEAARAARDQYDKDRLDLLGALEQSRAARAAAMARTARGSAPSLLPKDAITVYDDEIEALRETLGDDTKMATLAPADKLALKGRLAEREALRQDLVSIYLGQRGVNLDRTSQPSGSGIEYEDVPQ